MINTNLKNSHYEPRSKIIVFNQRKDQKFKVRFMYDQGKNAFGGHNGYKTFNKIKTADYINDCLKRNQSTELVNHTNFKFIRD